MERVADYTNIPRKPLDAHSDNPVPRLASNPQTSSRAGILLPTRRVKTDVFKPAAIPGIRIINDYLIFGALNDSMNVAGRPSVRFSGDAASAL